MSKVYAPLRRQPVKGIYLLFQLLTVFVRALWWALLGIPRAWRPRQSWSWGRTMVVKLVRYIDSVSEKVGVLTVSPDHRALVPGPGFHAVWVEPVPPEMIIGKVKMWASISAVSPVRLPGYWIHQPGSTIPLDAPLMPGEKIVFHLHGGAYTRMSAHPRDIPARIAHGLIEHVPCVHRSFAIEYRLSSTAPFPEEHPFPTALLDALTGYHHLVVTLGIPPGDIILMGDSAGGNLALALVRYLVEYRLASLPPPGLLLLCSPWADLSSPPPSRDSSLITCAHSDYLAPPDPAGGNLIAWSTRALIGPFGLGATETNAYISPASSRVAARFVGFPRTFVSAGGAEVLRDSIRVLNERMKRDLGKKVRYLEAEDSIHNFLALPWVQEPQRGETFQAIAEWVADAEG
ncbi:Alpha/Beta hydrolase protein [Mycena leptocephala]|nr:Alpha/Beta hydrolase protein [Mycena leptocephala]